MQYCVHTTCISGFFSIHWRKNQSSAFLVRTRESILTARWETGFSLTVNTNRLPNPYSLLKTFKASRYRNVLHDCIHLVMLRLLRFWIGLNWLFNVTINDISVIYVTAHRCAGGLNKKLYLRSGSHARHFAGFFNVPVLAPTRDHPFYTVIPTQRPT